VTGTEHYAIELIRALIRLNTRHQLTLYFRDPPAPDLFPAADRVEYRVIPFRRAWTHLRFAAALWRDRPDVTFVPAHTLPFWFPGRTVVTVHDLGFRHFPQAHPTRDRLYLDWTTRYSAHRATLILADSQATATDLGTFYGTPAAKIRVVYPGVETPAPSSAGQEATAVIAAVRQKYSLPERYFLFIGTLQPRKNIPIIVRAYQRWRQTQVAPDVGLVLAGGKGWLYDDGWVAGLPGLHLPGYIDETDKAALYTGAQALVFPSLYEGFGFPVVEAQRCGLPVITSTTSSLPELAGDAAVLVDPLDEAAIAQALGRLNEDETLRANLRQKGYARAAQFTWTRAAESALAALEAAASTYG
jgi:glycosyltransferase involved in cell wall biosynthesis